MLSPGTYHEQIPRELIPNVQYRQRLLAAARNKARKNAITQICKEDILYFVNGFVWQYNPRIKDGHEVGPFITWDFQDVAVLEMLWCIEHDRDLLIEKSREMGASWLCLLVMLWLFLFRPWQKFLCISRSEAAVEDDDPDSLFWKIDFILRYIPDWLHPGGVRSNIRRRKLYYGNLVNDSTITGQASTGRAGVGGRATAMFIDEFSQIKEDYEVFHRTSDTTGCRIFNGTHRGTGTCFAELADHSSLAGSYIKKLQMHWTQHPLKRPGLYTRSSSTTPPTSTPPTSTSA